MKQDTPSLHYFPLAPHSTFYHPPALPEVVQLTSPALRSMVDFKLHPPTATLPDITIDSALQQMKVSGIRFLFVVDALHTIIGGITSADIQSRKPVELSKRFDIPRATMPVSMVMTPAAEIHAVHLASLNNAEVAHVVQTLKTLGQSFFLVVEPGDISPIVRGLFSVAELNRQLDQDLNVLLGEANSLADLTRGQGY
jgi:CBS domain containing-hemolysin-like protein